MFIWKKIWLVKIKENIAQNNISENNALLETNVTGPAQISISYR